MSSSIWLKICQNFPLSACMFTVTCLHLLCPISTSPRGRERSSAYQVFKGMKEKISNYRRKQLYFLYMLCSEGARTLISQEGERNGKRHSSKMEQGQGDKRSREIKERKFLECPKLHWRDTLSHHPLDSQYIYDQVSVDCSLS